MTKTIALATEAEALKNALAERQRLDDLAATYRDNAAAVLAAKKETAARFDVLETEIALAGPGATAKQRKAHDVARTAALAADDEARRHQRVTDALPGLLAAADEAIWTAAEAYKSASDAFRHEVKEGLAGELEEAVRVLGETLRKVYAVSNALDLGAHVRLDENHVAGIGAVARTLLMGHRLFTSAGGHIDLTAAWMDNDDLTGTHAELKPIVDLAKKAEPHTRRIARDRELAAEREQDARRAVSAKRFGSQHSTLPIRPAPVTTAKPAPRFEPNSWTGAAGDTGGRTRTQEMNFAADVAANSDPAVTGLADEARRRTAQA
jgi:hypothetical protein